MASVPPENGVDGDDEREEEEDEEEEEEEAEENGDEAEEEPRLKYQRMGGNVPSLLSNDAASCIAVAARMIALGTHDGTVHILDFLGNQVKEFRSHTAPVNDLNFDDEGEYIGSCSDDGSVVINSLFTDDEKVKFDYHRPMKAISLDPDYTKNQLKRFVAGGLAGNLYMKSKNWFGGSTDQVLHSGEGPIHSVKWRGSLIAWANDAGVKVYDTAKKQRVTFIEKPRGSPRPEALLPHLVWQDDTILVIGWGTSVKIASIKSDQQKPGTYRQIQMSSVNQVDIVASFQTSYYISGIAPFGDSLVILAYIPIEGDGEKEFSTTTTVSRQGNAQRPEVRIVSWNNDELTMDALPVHGFEHYKAKDYSLAHAPFPGSSYGGGQWAAGDEPIYYIVSPKDVVIAKPRDAEDHINWLLQHGFHEKALAAVEAGEGRTELVDKVGAGYLDHLIVERKYAEAASLCPKLLRGSASAWERWVFHFAQLRQLPVLVPYMPTDNPRLKDTVYEVALVALATNPSYHKELLSAVKSWPRSVYSALTVISAIEPQLNTSSMTDALKEALAELYVIDGQYQKAFLLYADLLKPEVFDFIEKYSLHEAIRGKVVQLMLLDCKRATVLFIQNRDLIPPSEVVRQLLKASKKCDTRYYLYLYLHALFEVSHDTGRDFHDMQVELYAEYDTKMLLPFLRSSQHYKLEKAYELCVKKDFLREQVFVLGRMGNAKQALAVIINKLGDIEEAVEFVSLQHDDDLWEELIKQCLNKPEMVGLLLEHTVGNLDPLYIVNMVPNGLEIPRLRDRLVKIVTDYRTETSLRHGCNDILKTDIVNLLVKCFNEARRGVCLSNEEDDSRAKREDNNRLFSQRTVVDKSLSIKMTEVKSRTRGDTRCCMCFDPVSIRGDTVVVFFCCHAYHMTCLMDAAFSSSNNKTTKGSSGYEYSYGVDEEEEDEEEDEDDDDDGDRPGRSRLRCILCTTAAAESAR
ncbi:PREDICTED: vacuolar protein sorting-associated protein 41 homolog [Camelina sativa]|uniref:Vacuolar protein sorting-associated protein 41 homolog n=1 Tax=Camelina sativa TaxID=90675 RepID=A0ABM0XNL3_CAMSA|nr:PREDICTED: vacuolar protein sorting-associated protein 41 homolog [Camelina sativa]